METQFVEDPFSEPDAFMPSLHDDADLLQFLDGLDKHFAAPCPSDESSFEELFRVSGERARMTASKSLPDLPMASYKPRPADLSTMRTMSSDFTAVSFLRPPTATLSRVGSDVTSCQLTTPLAPPSEMSSSVITETWGAAEIKDQAVEQYLQHWDAAWGHDGIQHPGPCQSAQDWGAPSQDRVVPSSPTTSCDPVISGPPVAKPGALDACSSARRLLSRTC